MTVEKTDAQEREALQKIEEILEDFSTEDTYIGKAFEGCVEQARANIVNDGLESWKGWYLDEQMKNCRLSEKVVDLTKQLNQKDDAIARYEGVVQGKDREISRLNGVINDKDAAYTDLEGKLESQIVGEALIRRDYEARIGQMESDYKALQISYEGLKAAKKQEAAAEISDLRQMILELKAKLYDMMAGEEVEE